MQLSLSLVITASLMLPLAVFAPKGMAPLFALTVSTALIVHFSTRRSFVPIPWMLGAILALILAFAASSSFWSVTPERSLEASVPFAGFLLGFACLIGTTLELDAFGRNKVRFALLLGYALGLAILLIEGLSERSLLIWATGVLELEVNAAKWTLKPATTIAVILFWPILVVLQATTVPRLARLAVGGALVVSILSIGSDAAFLGLILAVVVYLSALRWDRMVGRVLAMAVTVAMLTAPVIPKLLPDPKISMAGIEYLPNSAVHRVFIWQTTAKHIDQRPWVGHGFDTARSLYPQETLIRFYLPKKSIGGLISIEGEPIPLHPHNMILQIWLELGAAGALLFLVALLMILRVLACHSMGKIERAAGYGLFVSTLTIAAVSYGAWQAWWLSAIGLCGALFVAVCSHKRSLP